jgi:hypothetical protein
MAWQCEVQTKVTRTLTEPSSVTIERTHTHDFEERFTYSRQLGPLLIQVSTTDPCEAWHREVKAGARLKKRQVAGYACYLWNGSEYHECS